MVAFAKLVQGQQPWCGGLGDSPGQFLHGLHDMRQALWGRIAQPCWQVLFEQQGVTCSQGVLAAHQAGERLLAGQRCSELVQVR